MHALIHWWSRNHIAANFLMFALIASGLLAWTKLRKEIFPEISTGTISVTVPYPNASPEEVETGICIPVEEAIATVDGLKRITSRASEGVGAVFAEIQDGYHLPDVLAKVKARVDGIRNFAENAEEPVIEDIPIRAQILSVAVTADTDEKTLRAVAERVRDGLTALENVTEVTLAGVRKHEISIEVSEHTLREHGLNFDQVAAAVRLSSLDLPGGSVRTRAGEILIRTQAKKYSAAEFAEITVLTRPDGSRVRLGDVAKIVDGFEEVDVFTRFDGKNAVLVNVYRSGDEDTLDVAKAVKEYLKEAPRHLPAGVKLEIWNDTSLFLEGRLSLMLQDAAQGFVLVYIMLSLFLRPALAFHVAMGIPIAFAGGLLFLPWLGISINMISLFAFIVVLGIVTDDAIVVGENVYERMRRGEPAKLAAPRGTYEVMVVAIFGVLTVACAFLPMAAVPGVSGKIWVNIPYVVLPVLLVSLIETNLILPAHLSHLKPEPPDAEVRSPVVKLQRWMTRKVDVFILKVYRPVMDFALRFRYATLATFVSVLLLILGLIAGNWIRFEFFPVVEAEVISAKLTLPNGVPVEVTDAAIRRMEAAADELNKYYKGTNGRPLIVHKLASVGSQPFQTSFAVGGSNPEAHVGEVTIELLPASEREVKADEVASKWRELTGPIPGAVELTFLTNTARSGSAIDLELHGPDLERLRIAAERVKAALNGYAGVTDVTDSNRSGKRELKLNILPHAETLGLRLGDVARQVRQAFFGEEAQRLQRGRDEVKVMVRYPREERRSLANLTEMKIRTPDGAEAPFSEVAEAREGRGFSSIYRADRQRAVRITADIDPRVPGANANAVVAAMNEGVFKELKRDFPDISWGFQGEQKDQRESMTAIAAGGMVALVGIFILLAVPLRSVVQPLIVMSVIPFGMVGAVIGHVLLGIELSIMSMIGIVALCGVVVNESLVLVEYVNRHRRSGRSVVEAAREGGAARFQAIMLTSVTSFIGVMPIVTETSLQAKFLIPCAVSLAFGCLSNLVNTLVLVPCVYAILEDGRALIFTKEKIRQWEEQEREEARERGLDWMEPVEESGETTVKA